MKRYIFFGVALVGLLILTNVVDAQEAVIHTNKLNVRSGPGLDYDRIGYVYKDDVLLIIQKENDWVAIEFEDGIGWISTDYITIREHDDKNEEFHVYDTVQQTLTIPLNNVHVRSGPSTAYDITFFVHEGHRVEVISENEDWYEITYEGQEGFIFKQLVSSHQTNQPTPLTNKLIVIDAGHGGRDVGAIGAHQTLEKYLTYQTANMLKHELTRLGAQVKLTRENDNYISLMSRTTFSNMLPTDVFISIHYNSFPDLPNITGISSYYYKPQDKPLAQMIQNSLIQMTGDHDRGITIENFQVLRQNFNPAVLVELGFLSNQQQEQQLLNRTYQQKIVKGISDGLITYFSEKE